LRCNGHYSWIPIPLMTAWEVFTEVVMTNPIRRAVS
jgi:hypothetical protein